MYTRNCPKCNKELTYKYNSDKLKADRVNSVCKKCMVNSGQFKDGCEGSNITNKPNFNLDKLLDESLISFYWMGLLLADGSFYKNRFEISLQKRDEGLIDKFISFLNLTNISKTERNGSVRIYFNNKESINLIKNTFDIQDRKTYNPPKFQYYKNYPLDSLTALLIGVIDGDGNIRKNGSKGSAVITITAHKAWKSFYKRLLNTIKIDNTIHNAKNRNTITIRVYRKELLIRLYNFALEYKLPILNRKWIKIKQIS